MDSDTEDEEETAVADHEEESKELVWVLAYSGNNNSTELTSLVPATQYQLWGCGQCCWSE